MQKKNIHPHQSEMGANTKKLIDVFEYGYHKIKFQIRIRVQIPKKVLRVLEYEYLGKNYILKVADELRTGTFPAE